MSRSGHIHYTRRKPDAGRGEHTRHDTSTAWKESAGRTGRAHSTGRWWRGAAALCTLTLMATVTTAIGQSAPNTQSPRVDALTALDSADQRDDLNLIFILIDTLRSDHLSAYGYERRTSPILDSVAAAGIRFAHVRSQCSWTKPSMASMWTSSYVARTGVVGWQHALPEEATMPAEILSKAGFRTAGIWRNGWIANNFGFAQGFDVYFRPSPARRPERIQTGNPSAQAFMPTDLDATESAAQFLRTFGEERFFLYLHLMDVHQYLYDQDSAQFGPQYDDAYDNSILWVDKNVGLVLAELEKLGLDDDTIVVIGSDHGEAFGEHGGEGHGRNLYREVTEVPLIIKLPQLLTEGVVVEPLVQNVDIWPTLLELLGAPELPSAQGTSLLPLIRHAAGDDTVEDHAAVAERAAFSQIDRGWGRKQTEPRPLVSVSHDGYRLFHPVTPPGRDQLFDHKADPKEIIDVTAAHPEVVADLRARIDEYLAVPEADWGGAVETDIDDMRLEQLRALGYMGGPGGQDEHKDPHGR